MTDGQENASRITLRQLVNEIQAGNQRVPVVIFCVAYGSDADYEMLQALADASGGQVRDGHTGDDPGSVQDPVAATSNEAAVMSNETSIYERMQQAAQKAHAAERLLPLGERGHGRRARSC